MNAQQVRMIKNFYCQSIDAEVHIEYLAVLQYQTGLDLIAGELVFNPDCERKDHCGIARREGGAANYDWSGCINPELRRTVYKQEVDMDKNQQQGVIR